MMLKEKLHIHFKNEGNVSKTGRGLGSHEDVSKATSLKICVEQCLQAHFVI